MAAFLLLVLLHVSSGAYDVQMSRYPDMAACKARIAELIKDVPKQPGISYSLACLTMRSTEEKPS